MCQDIVLMVWFDLKIKFIYKYYSTQWHLPRECAVILIYDLNDVICVKCKLHNWKS